MSKPTTYTVRQLADLAGVTPRTLHYYDAIGLLRPSAVGDNGYRQYDEAAALERHRAALAARAGRLQHLIHTIDRTLLHLQGEIEMSTPDLFAGFDEETQARYEKEAAEMYDPKVVAESSRRWKSYTAEDKARIQREGGQVYQALVPLLGRDPADAEVQAVVRRWHQHLRAFYEPTPEILRGLGQAYAEQPEFSAFFAALHPDLPAFLSRAIESYVASGAAR